MKRFKSYLGDKIEVYIGYRRSLGYQETHTKCNLAHLDCFVYETSTTWSDLKPAFFLDFINKLNLAPLTINRIISTIRGFLRYLERLEIIEENPLKDISYVPLTPYIPFLFSPKETKKILTAIQKKIRKNPKHYFRDYALYLVILLIIRCGLRISEPLKLKIDDYLICEGTLYIRNTKFNKDRLIPVPLSTMETLNNYLSARTVMVDSKSNPYLFPGKSMHKITKKAVYDVYYQALKDIGIKQEKKVFDNIRFGKPTPHSLRHSFAVNTLKEIKFQGKSPQDALPVLAAYMGHKHYQYTSVYLKALDAQHRQALFDITQKHFKDI
jgi:integrase